jgi:hypothetical protein
VDAVTVSWLQGRLAENGVSDQLSGFSVAPVGTGLMGATYRLALEYAARTEDAPESLIFKVTGEGAISRKLGRRGYGLAGKPGFYGSEVRFYAELAARLPIRTPRSWYTWLSEEEDEFVLLLEDITPARAGDELDGCTPAQAERALSNLAGLHAPMWNSPDFLQPGLLQRPTPEGAGVFQGFVSKAWRRWPEHAAVMGSDNDDIVEAFVSRCAVWFEATGQNMSLTHNDFRLDNLMFAESGECVTVDWQSFLVAHNGRDIGLFLGCSVPTDLRRKHQDHLLQAYCDRMVDLGVSEYTIGQCNADFRLGAFLGIQNVLIGMSAVSVNDRGLQMFKTTFDRCCATIRDCDSLAALLVLAQ